MSTEASNGITIESLIRKGLVHPETAAKHAAKLARFDIILGGEGQAVESQSTTFMTMADGPLEKALIGAICDAAGVPDRDGIRLLSGTEFRHDSDATDRRTIDMVCARRINDQSARGSLAWQPVVATEAKYGAWVNGGHGYCAKFPEAYSNQVICYLHGCIDARLDENVKFVWLGNATAYPDLGPWGRKGIHEGDFEYAGLEEAFGRQLEAKDVWKSMTWPDLGRAIKEALEPLGFSAEADAIVRLLRAHGPSVN